MLSNITQKGLAIVEDWMYNQIKTLGKQDGRIYVAFSTLAVLGATFVDANIVFSLPLLVAIEQVAFAAINFLGNCLGFEACNSEDGWDSLKSAIFFKFREGCFQIPHYYSLAIIASIMMPYHNLQNPKEAESIYNQLIGKQHLRKDLGWFNDHTLITV